ncbi:MAG TPA: non-canonical purine NTP pyrophosphatase [Gaiellaceae bacterium]|nr:non-canonical purine NTP pyrophosphatase [Gaiellaceae bacterium]
MKVVLASGNPHKARELRAILPGWEIEPLVTDRDPPPERGSTFAENALGKARFGRKILAREGVWVVGEDSGLEVDALYGAPGILSARYAGDAATDEANLRKLLDQLRGQITGRQARYVCELVGIGRGGDEIRATGELRGRIAEAPSGSGGFGYDPVFVPEGEERTVAELGDAWKSVHSHRAHAARAFARALEARTPVE